jgi:hypothetical protein
LEESPLSDYRFPLTTANILAAKNLMAILNGGRGDVIHALHVFTAPFLSGQDFSANYDYSEYSKWNDVIECFLAVYALNEDGNFKSPKDVTGVFAKIEYLCRGATLYDGLTLSKQPLQVTYHCLSFLLWDLNSNPSM